MATVTNVTLTITPGSASKANVRVQGAVQFAATDIGTPHRLGIDLYAVQAPSDSIEDIELLGSGLLYTFLWGKLFLQKP